MSNMCRSFYSVCLTHNQHVKSQSCNTKLKEGMSEGIPVSFLIPECISRALCIQQRLSERLGSVLTQLHSHKLTPGGCPGQAQSAPLRLTG